MFNQTMVARGNQKEVVETERLGVLTEVKQRPTQASLQTIHLLEQMRRVFKDYTYQPFSINQCPHAVVSDTKDKGDQKSVVRGTTYSAMM